jgi:hypothetical protein
MVKIGELRTLRASKSRNVIVFVLEKEEDENEALVALVSKNITKNYSRIKLDDDLFVYPALQGNVSLYSLGAQVKLKNRDLPSSHLSIARKWPALSESLKEDAAKDFSGIIFLGDSTLQPTQEFIEDHRLLYKVCHSYHSSLNLGAQFQSEVIMAIPGNQIEPMQVISLSSAALFSANSVLGIIDEVSQSMPQGLGKNLILRNAVRIRTQRSTSSGKTNVGELDYLFEFMERFDVNPLTYVVKGPEMIPRGGLSRKAELTIHFQKMNA